MKTQEEQMEFQKYDYHNLMINALKTIKEANLDYIRSIWEMGYVIGFICFFTFPPLIHTFLPQYYNSIFSELFTLCLIIFMLNVSAATVDHGIIVPTGYAKLMTWTYSVLAILNIPLNLILIKLFDKLKAS